MTQPAQTTVRLFLYFINRRSITENLRFYTGIHTVGKYVKTYNCTITVVYAISAKIQNNYIDITQSPIKARGNTGIGPE